MNTIYLSNKKNYRNLLGGFSNDNTDNTDTDLLEVINEKYEYKRGLNENNKHQYIDAGTKKYSTIYGEVFTKNADGKNSINILRNIANFFGADFFGDIGSGRGMLPMAMSNVVKEAFGCEILYERHDEAVKFMENELNKNNWSIKKTCSPDTLGYAVLPDGIGDPKLYANTVMFKHNMNGKIIKYINADMFYVNWKQLLKDYKKPMFWISNLCFPELTEDLFVMFKDVFPVGTIIVLSRAPKNIESCNFKKVHNLELGIHDGELVLPQTWANNHTVTVVEKK